jgi:hypothetical protein
MLVGTMLGLWSFAVMSLLPPIAMGAGTETRSDYLSLLVQLKKQTGTLLASQSQIMVDLLKDMVNKSTDEQEREEWQSLADDLEMSSKMVWQMLESDNFDVSMEDLSTMESFKLAMNAVLEKLMELDELDDDDKLKLKLSKSTMELGIMKFKLMITQGLRAKGEL